MLYLEGVNINSVKQLIINIEGNVQNTSGYIIYSETGDITLGYKGIIRLILILTVLFMLMEK